MSTRSNRSACAVAVVLGLALAGCSSSGTVDNAAPSTTGAGSAGGSSTTSGDPGPSGSSGSDATGTGASASGIDPRAAEPCEILDQDQLTGLLGATPDPGTPNEQTYEIGCSWSVPDGPTLDLLIETERPGQEAYDGVMQYLEVSEGTEPVDVGDVAVLKVTDGDETQVVLDAVINGWYVSLTAWGVDDPEGLVSIARDVEDSLVAFTPAAGGDAASSGSAGDDAAPGTLKRFEVTIDAPADLAGTTNTENLGQVGFAGYANCSQAGDAYFTLAFNTPPAEDPPTPVGVFNITVDGSVEAGETVDATVGVGLGRSDLATTTTYEGTITMGEDGRSGTFQAGIVTGSWVCERVE